MPGHRVEGKQDGGEFGRELTTARELAEMNRCRSNLGLPLLEVKKRVCLRCGKDFHSTGKRMCWSCNDYIRGYRLGDFTIAP